MRVRIKRQDRRDTEPYFAEFDYAGSGAEPRRTVARILDELNYSDDLFDTTGNRQRKIVWECGCLQKVCGGCAMVINGTPALACATFVDTEKQAVLTLEPLTKFPVVCDLQVDRSILMEQARRAEMYAAKCAPVSPKEFAHQYSAAKCLKCGLCLEICPNYTKGQKFFGAAFANEAYLLYHHSEDRKRQILKAYRKYFESFCSKSFACQKICPMKIQTLSSIAKMNGKF